MRDYMRSWRQSHREQLAEYHRKYYAAHLEERRAQMREAAKRRRAIRGAKGESE